MLIDDKVKNLNSFLSKMTMYKSIAINYNGMNERIKDFQNQNKQDIISELNNLGIYPKSNKI